MQNLENNQLWELMGAEVHNIVADDKRELFIQTIRPVIKSPEEALFWAQCLCTDQLTHGDEERVVVCEAGHDFYQAAVEAVDEHGDDFKYFINHIMEKTGVRDRKLEMPIRIALTGVLHGPDLEYVFKLIGPEQARIRLEQVMDLCHCH